MKKRIEAFVALELEKLSPQDLKAKLQTIGTLEGASQ